MLREWWHRCRAMVPMQKSPTRWQISRVLVVARHLETEINLNTGITVAKMGIPLSLCTLELN